MDQNSNEVQARVTHQTDGAELLPSVGDLVYSSDGAELGTVETVLSASPAQDCMLIVIAKGVFLDACRCVEIRRVLSVKDGIVTLDLKARQVEHLPPCQTCDQVSPC